MWVTFDDRKKKKKNHTNPRLASQKEKKENANVPRIFLFSWFFRAKTRQKNLTQLKNFFVVNSFSRVPQPRLHKQMASRRRRGWRKEARVEEARVEERGEGWKKIGEGRKWGRGGRRRMRVSGRAWIALKSIEVPWSPRTATEKKKKKCEQKLIFVMWHLSIPKPFHFIIIKARDVTFFFFFARLLFRLFVSQETNDEGQKKKFQLNFSESRKNEENFSKEENFRKRGKFFEKRKIYFISNILLFLLFLLLLLFLFLHWPKVQNFQ